MTGAETKEVTNLMEKVQSWSMPMRIALARRILETLEKPTALNLPPHHPRGPTAAEVMALFKTDKPAPDDSTVKQWINDHRTGKYGN